MNRYEFKQIEFPKPYGVRKGDIRMQNRFIDQVLGLAA
jgi:hypothetical protein